MQQSTSYESIVFMGKITCGKGTQAAEVIKAYNGTMFSIGDKFREMAAMDTPLGAKVKVAYEEGLLAPKWLAGYWMTHALLHRHADELLVFEAVARKPEEAEIFDEIHRWTSRPYIVFNLEIPDEVVYERSAARNRDVVDGEAAVTKRLQEFNEYTSLSLEIFRKAGNVVDIDGTLPVEEVQKIIAEHLNQTN